MFPYQVGIKWYLVAKLISISLIISKIGCLFPWALVCSRPCKCPPSVKFLYSPVLWNSCNQTLMFFKARFSGGSSSCCQTLWLGRLRWGSELSLLWQNFYGITVFQFVGCPPRRYGILFYCDFSLLPSLCGFFFAFGCRIPFLVGASVLLLMVIQQLVVILVFT